MGIRHIDIEEVKDSNLLIYLMTPIFAKIIYMMEFIGIANQRIINVDTL